MARNTSMIVILAVAAFLALSIMFRFGAGGSGITVLHSPINPTKETSATGAGAGAGTGPVDVPEGSPVKMSDLGITDQLLTGKVIAPKLENATAK
jgi:hypothetical protein